MCIVFTCGEHTFRKEVEGYEGIICRCVNCGNYSGHVIKTHPWFTLCFVVSPVQLVQLVRLCACWPMSALSPAHACLYAPCPHH